MAKTAQGSRQAAAPDFMSRGETAKLLGLSLPGITSMMFGVDDPLPFYVVGHRYKFDRGEVLEYCRRRARELVTRKQAEKTKLKAARRTSKCRRGAATGKTLLVRRRRPGREGYRTYRECR